MPLTTSTEMLLSAQAGGYAIGAFNIENLEMLQAVVSAAEEMNSPVIIQTTPGTVKYAGLDVYKAMTAVVAAKAKVPVALHLDHGDTHDLATRAIEQGYTSVMIDGSFLSFEGNIDLTIGVVKVAKPMGIPVEAELGTVGGKEDDHDGGMGAYTIPSLAKEFVERTEVSSLAVAIGTAHGVYRVEPRLDVERLKQIRDLVEVPLILHGASGISTEQIHECIKNGICKVNFATELRKAYTAGVKEFIKEKPDAFDPKGYGAAGRETVKKLVIDLIKTCGCAGRAK